mmetsp:Transcript_25909/g.97587  ORF Transcript_25909/g.97587 Transcript_25909/m.97587 type:complete len:358 (+) Transcript_25909:154-1227(+)
MALATPASTVNPERAFAATSGGTPSPESAAVTTATLEAADATASLAAAGARSGDSAAAAPEGARPKSSSASAPSECETTKVAPSGTASGTNHSGELHSSAADHASSRSALPIPSLATNSGSISKSSSLPTAAAAPPSASATPGPSLAEVAAACRDRARCAGSDSTTLDLRRLLALGWAGHLCATVPLLPPAAGCACLAGAPCEPSTPSVENAASAAAASSDSRISPPAPSGPPYRWSTPSHTRITLTPTAHTARITPWNARSTSRGESPARAASRSRATADETVATSASSITSTGSMGEGATPPERKLPPMTALSATPVLAEKRASDPLRLRPVSPPATGVSLPDDRPVARPSLPEP